MFPGGRLNEDVVARSCREIGAMVGVDIPASARIILLPAKGAGAGDVLAKVSRIITRKKVPTDAEIWA